MKPGAAAVATFLASSYLGYRRFARSAPQDPARRAEPRRFAGGLVRRGAVFVKLGQILSTRPDLLPAEYLSALGELQERVPAFDPAEARRTVERELGGTVAAHFASFGDAPLASASLAQVHPATLRDGTEVAVKVQRPGVAQRVRRDLRSLARLLGLIRLLLPRLASRTDLLAAFREFRRYTLLELDFHNEGRTIERFRKNFRGWNDIVFPRVYWATTRRRVLTMERVSGMRLAEAVRMLPEPSRRALCVRLAEMELKMFISDGLFHADLHPGNIFFREDGSIVLLDFGMYGELERAQRHRFVLYWLAVTQNQVRRAFEHFRAQCVVLPGNNEGAFYREFKALATAFYTSPLAEVSITKVYLGMMRAGYQHGYLLPASLLLHAKALTTAESLAFTLAPDMRFEEVTRPIIARELAGLVLREGMVDRLASALPELLLTGKAPEEPAGAMWSGLPGRQNGTGLLAMLDADVRDALSRVAPPLDVDRVMRVTWDEYGRLEASLPAQKALGATAMVHLAAATLALHRALVDCGRTARQATWIVYDVGWRIYRRMGEVPILFAGLFSQSPRDRMEMATRAFRMFPFGSPGYGWEDAEGDDVTVAFRCTRCPVAEYFLAHGQGELCRDTWCRLDYPLAELWGGSLERSGTIAGGAPVCDFRWKVSPRG